MNKKALLLVTIGAPGSGKSYFSKKFCKEYHFAHLRSDEIRKYVFSHPTYTQKENTRLFKLINFMLEKLLAGGVSVIYDANFTKKESRTRASRIAKKYKANFAILWLSTPIDVAIKRARSRNYHPVDKGVVLGLHRELELPKDEPVIVIDGTKPYDVQKSSVLSYLG